MSNQVANVGIEDVLSSIRKLVSSEDVPERQPVTAQRPKKANKLVLTPALRVSDSVAEPEHRAPPKRVSAVPWRNPKTTLFEAAQAHEPDGADAPPAKPRPMLLRPEDAVPNEKIAWIRPEVAKAARAEDAQTLGEAADGFAFHGQNAVDDEDGASDEPPLTKKIEALEAAIARTDDQWEPDGATDEDYSGTKVEPAIGWQDRAPSDGTATGPDVASRVEIAAASVVEPAIDESDPGHSASPVQGQAELAAEDKDAVRADDTQQTASVTAEGIPAANEAVLDEERLQKLVAEIVRQELQGVLGERITRNVRKLVRREIQRALTARDLG
ncbi:MAG: hypothetical protein AB3N15_12600 [Paracoccaceae bacterium]